MAISFKHLVSASALTREDMETLFSVADGMQQIRAHGGDSRLQGKILASLFYEPSTRTRLSTESAMLRLGGSVLTADGLASSSLKKGESIEDTIKMAAQYADVICMRHPEEGSAARAAAVSGVPFINGGDGGNQHPTQSLMDVYTIHREKGQLDHLHVAFGCDPLHSRSIRSLAMLMSLFPGNRFTFISPPQLRAESSLLEELRARGCVVGESEDLEEGAKADVLYMNRLQAERFKDPAEAERYRAQYCVTADMVKGKSVTIMDPLPRVGEIAEDVDALPNAAYFRQASNGVPIRMALLALLLGKA